MHRRDFIKSGALSTGAWLLPDILLPQKSKLKLAILGTGNWGREVVLKGALSSGVFDVVALCDVDTVALTAASGQVVAHGSPRPRQFTSHTEMFAMKGLDAVAIVTPTHWHALQFIDACRRGLHVFLEKPVSYDIREGQAMLAAHREAGNVVQVDFPRVKGKVNREVMAFIRSGEAGTIRQVVANINHHEGQLSKADIPTTLDFESFCGPAPRPDFLTENGRVPMWRGQRAFSRGILFDWGIHYIHNARLVLGLGLPDNVMAMGGITRNTTHDNPDHLDVRFDFNGVPVMWSHKTWGYHAPIPANDYGLYYYGDKATVFAGDMGWEVYTKDGATNRHGDARFNPGEPGQWNEYLRWTEELLVEFAECVRNRSNDDITNTLGDAVITTNTVIYADMAYQLRTNLQIDRKSMEITNSEAGKAHMQRSYRSPYVHPYVA